MSLLPLFSLLVLVVVAVGTTAVVARRPFQAHAATVADAVRHSRRISAAALLIGGVAAVAAGYAAELPAITGESVNARNGVAAISIPLAFGLAHTGALLVGELTWPKPAGDLRRARLERRGLLDSVPRWLLRLAQGALVTGLVVVVAGALVARPDGRTVTVTTGGGAVQGAAAPFAGTDYGLPTAAGLVFLAALTGYALWVVSGRAALGTADDEAERVLRRASAHRVLRGATTAASVTVGGLLAVSSMSLRNAATGAIDTARANDLPVDRLTSALPQLGAVLALVGLVGALVGVGVLGVRAPRPAAEPLAPVGA